MFEEKEHAKETALKQKYKYMTEKSDDLQWPSILPSLKKRVALAHPLKFLDGVHIQHPMKSGTFRTLA
jgi:hypothetical protein